MRVVATLRGRLVIAFIMFLIILWTVPLNSFARQEFRYELISGDFSFGNDFGRAKDTQNLFHQKTLQTIDDESLNINFPVFDSFNSGSANNILAPGPAEVKGDELTGSANVLPFGPVDLAFPDISQIVFQSIAASSTGFYSATFLGIPPVNTGAGLVWSGPGTPISPVTSPPRIAGPNTPFPEMVNTAAGTERTAALAAASKASNTTSGNKTRSSLSPSFSSMKIGSG